MFCGSGGSKSRLFPPHLGIEMSNVPNVFCRFYVSCPAASSSAIARSQCFPSDPNRKPTIRVFPAGPQLQALYNLIYAYILHMFTCMYIYLYTYIYIYVYLYIHIHICIYLYTYAGATAIKLSMSGNGRRAKDLKVGLLRH